MDNNVFNAYGRSSASPRQPTSQVSTKRSNSSIRRDEVDHSGGVGVDGGYGGESRLEKKRSVIRREPNGTGSVEALRVNTQPQQDPRDDLIEDLKADLEKLRKSCTCVICQELLFEPYFFQCGHIYCYGVSKLYVFHSLAVLIWNTVYRVMGWSGYLQKTEILPTVPNGDQGRTISRLRGLFTLRGPTSNHVD